MVIISILRSNESGTRSLDVLDTIRVECRDPHTMSNEGRFYQRGEYEGWGRKIDVGGIC